VGGGATAATFMKYLIHAVFEVLGWQNVKRKKRKEAERRNN